MTYSLRSYGEEIPGKESVLVSPPSLAWARHVERNETGIPLPLTWKSTECGDGLTCVNLLKTTDLYTSGELHG